MARKYNWKTGWIDVSIGVIFFLTPSGTGLARRFGLPGLPADQGADQVASHLEAACLRSDLLC